MEEVLLTGDQEPMSPDPTSNDSPPAAFDGTATAAPTNTSQEDPENDSENLLSGVLYSISSFQAIITPVSITMILSALAVVHINTDETRADGEAAYSQTYQVFDLEEGNSTQNFLASIANVLIIVSVICVMTFVIVILYKYGCTKIFLGYMILVTTMLLGYFTSNIALVAIEKYELRVDKISFAYVIWNYAIVGVLAIFYNNGIPKFVTQGYLVTSSVVLAWQLSYFNDWTAWTLLVMLALYDLFAVLSPYGPLKALTNLMSRPGAQPLPGLLYEANLPTGVSRPGNNNNDANATTENADEASTRPGDARDESTADVTDRSTPIGGGDREGRSSTFINESLPDDETRGSSASFRNHGTMATRGGRPQRDPESGPFATATSQESVEPSLPPSARPEQRQGTVALAIAKLYKLRVIDEDGVLRKRGWRGNSNSDYQREYSPEEVRTTEWTAKQLRAEVAVVFPARGGRIVKSEEQNDGEGTRYLVYSRHETLLRTFVVNREGKVLQVVKKEQESDPEPNNIKLGLVSLPIREFSEIFFAHSNCFTGRLYFLLCLGLESCPS